MKFMSLLKESQNRRYDFGCTMLYFNFPEINHIHKLIDPNHLYVDEYDDSYGLENEPHTTLLFGTHDDVTVDDVKNTLNGFTFNTCRVHNPSLFQNEMYDVLKFDVNGPNLHDANNELRKFPHTNNFPDYHPHLTIAYLKPGMGPRYVRKLTNMNYMLKPTHGIYSHPNGEKTRIDLNLE